MYYPCTLKACDINGQPVTLTDKESALYLSFNSMLGEIVMNLARFGANTLRGDLPRDDERHTTLANYDGTPCIIQWYVTPRCIVMTVLFNPRTELLEMGLETLNGMELDSEVTATNFTQYAEAFCTTDYGDRSNYPDSVSGSGGCSLALARIAACPTETSYKKIDYPSSAVN